MLKSGIALFILCFSLAGTAQLQVPPLTDPVIDQGGLIQPQDQRLLRELIYSFHERGKGQIQVLTLRSLGGVPVEQASIQILDQWKLGDKKRDDGVLILVSAEEHKIRIEVGQGLEGVLPDIVAKRTIEDVMVPLFRKASPSAGIVAGALQVMKTIDPSFDQGGEMVNPEPRQRSTRGSYEGIFILIFVIIMILSNLIRPRRRSFWGGFGGGGWGSGGGFGGGSGGGWGGGGGGFSGGGASGNW